MNGRRKGILASKEERKQHKKITGQRAPLLKGNLKKEQELLTQLLKQGVSRENMQGYLELFKNKEITGRIELMKKWGKEQAIPQMNVTPKEFEKQLRNAYEKVREERIKTLATEIRQKEEEKSKERTEESKKSKEHITYVPVGSGDVSSVFKLIMLIVLLGAFFAIISSFFH